MLDSEEAKARLAAVRRAHWQAEASRRAGTLSRKHQSVSRTLLEDPPVTHDAAVRQQHADLNAAAVVLDEISDKDRLAIMKAIHPQLGPVLARWWVDAQRQPYSTGWSRKAFRAPATPSITRSTRVQSLRDIVSFVGPYDRDAVWLAAWAPHVEIAAGMFARTFPHHLAGPLLAAAIDLGGSGGDEVLHTLIEIGNGEHPVGVMDRHVIVALLRASRVEGWEFIERLLLAAQRQEGLRQSILESVDEAHPQAFTRMLDLVLDQNLLRFAAAVRAAGTWIGFAGDVEEIPKITERVSSLRTFRADPAACRGALTDGDAWDTYLALCSVAMHDVVQALQWADAVLLRPSPDARAAAVRFVASTSLTSTTTRLLAILDDPHLEVAALANAHLSFDWSDSARHPPEAFDRLERFVQRLPPGDRTGATLGIETVGPSLARGEVVNKLFRVRGDRPLVKLLPWIPDMDATTRSGFARDAGRSGSLSPDVREVLVTMVGDRSSTVRDAAVRAMEKLHVDPVEAPFLEALLTRNAGDLRRGVIRLLASQDPQHAVASAGRLWATGHQAQRDAACELLSAIPDRPVAAQRMAGEFATSGPTTQQRELLAAAIGQSSGDSETAAAVLPYRPQLRTPQREPRASPRRQFASDASARIVSALDDLAHSHRDTVITVSNWQGTVDVLLADVKGLPSPFQFRPPGQADGDEEGRGLILAEVFREWWRSRPGQYRASGSVDALEALVTSLVVSGQRSFHAHDARDVGWWQPQLQSMVGQVGSLRHRLVVEHVLLWMVAEEADGAVVDECLDAYETLLARVPASTLSATPQPPIEHRWNYVFDWRDMVVRNPWSMISNGLLAIRPELFGREHLSRALGLARWIDEPTSGAKRHPVGRPLVQAAARSGVATDDDVRDCMVDPRSRMLKDFTRRRRQPLEIEFPRIIGLADEMRERVLEIERTRGELPTAASEVAVLLGSISGAAITMELLARLGRASLVRGGSAGHGREGVYSHLLRVSYPSATDDAVSLRSAAKSAKVKDKRLIELAMFAPQWARLIGEGLGWDGFDDAVWWFHAHTKDNQWGVDAEVRESWTALSAERTPLSGEDLLAGAVDFSWFHRAHGTLGSQRWEALHVAAKLASGGSGHRRAQIFSEAMLGALTEEALLSRMAATRHQDSVRAMGLVPLPADATDRDAVTLRRYLALREFERGSSKFGNQRQISERAAVRIGIENLARSAGLIDPQRFIWAMEAAEAGDLANGPVTAVDGDVTVTLAVDVEGQAELTVARAGKALKSVPPALRKSPAIAALRDRKTALSRQATRVRASVEAAMVREDAFTDGDLVLLDRHPVVAPMLQSVVFVDEIGHTMRRLGRQYVDVTGSTTRPTGDLRIAHPVDLLGAGNWIAWQQQLFIDEKRQPFKQVFRELYTLTATERAQGPGSHRYEGHQIQPRQAMALFGRRGWLTDRENGDVSRVFHQHGFVARVDFLNGSLTPAEVELPTLRGVYFTKQGEYVAQPIDSVPPIVFSETMRDLDLVVSIAHAGGVDPETTASTLEMRAALVRETARLTKLDNIRLLDSHVVIEGTLGEYSVHLGSGVVHRRPGGALCIIPVDSQRRGRIFLPFADDDPKTAEVIAKVLLLARDKQIKDPTILEQLRS